MNKIIGISLAIIILLVGCSTEKKKNILPKEMETNINVDANEETFSTELVDVPNVNIISKMDSSIELDNNGSLFSEGLLVARDIETQRYGFIDKTGNWVIDPKFTYVYSFSDGLAIAEIESEDGSTLSGYIDKTGEWIIQPQFLEAQNFNEGLAMVSYPGEENLMFIDKLGQQIIELNETSLSIEESFFPNGFSEGLAPVRDADRAMGFIDKEGSWIIEPQFNFATGFSDSLALARDNNMMYGFIDKTGQWIIEPQFTHNQIDSFTTGTNYTYFSEGLALLKGENDKFGFIDKTGNWVIEPQFESPSHFSGGLARVDKSDQTYFIDKTGNPIIDISVQNAWNFGDGFAVINDYSDFYIISNPLEGSPK